MSTRARSPAPVARGRSPAPRGRSPTGVSPKRGGIRDPSPGAHSARERRNSFTSDTASSRMARRRTSISPVPHLRGRAANRELDRTSGESEAVRVVLRVRPFNSAEDTEQSMPCLIPSANDEVSKGVTYLDRKAQYEDDYEDEANMFHFDRVFYPEDIHNPGLPLQSSEQHEVYNMVGPPCLTNLFDSYNSCVFAYGQTGSGKTHTMMGVPGAEGIVPRFCRDLLGRYEALPPLSQEAIRLQASFVEIYCEQLYDLMASDNTREKREWVMHGEGTGARHTAIDSTLSRRKLSLRQHPVHGLSVAGAVTFDITSYQQLESLVRQGMSARSTACTTMNDTSSRSHAMFQITLEMQVPQKGRGGGASPYRSRQDTTTFSTANMRFVDLAGSENLKKSGSNGDRMHESIHINTSLLALRRVIDQLIENKAHAMPAYRESKLTRLLSDCLGGNSKTWFLACVSPSQANAEETKNTLRYASKATRIINCVTRNMDVGARIEEDLVQLREELALARGAEVEELKALITQHESSLVDMGQAMDTMRQGQEERERIMRDKELEAERAIADARREAQASRTAEVQQAKEEAEMYRLRLEGAERATAHGEMERAKLEAEEKAHWMDRCTALEHKTNETTKRYVNTTLYINQSNRKTQQHSHTHTSTTTNLHSAREQNDEIERRFREDMEAMRRELTDTFHRQLASKQAEADEARAKCQALKEDKKDATRRLQDELVKQRLEHASAMAHAERRWEADQREWGETREEIERRRNQDASRMSSDAHSLRASLEAEVRARRKELADLERRHAAELRREKERAEQAHTQLAEAEIRAGNIERKFGAVDGEIRNMEDVYGRSQRLLTAAEEQDFEGHEQLLALVKDVNNWGRQLKSLRTDFTHLVTHRGRPDSEDYLPSRLESVGAGSGVDPSQGRHRRSSSSRRLRKL